MSFLQFGFSPSILQAIIKSGFISPTAIQKKVIPLILDGKDVMARAQTGSGKSASFVLPLLELMSRESNEGKAKIKILVLTPTRELTQQIVETFNIFSTLMDKTPKVVGAIGGEKTGEQLFAIQKGCDILVATMGRFFDILSKKQMDLSFIKYFVLDEADKMLDLGFVEDLGLILKVLPANRQNLLFSATYPPKMLSIASKITQNPIEISIEDEKYTVQNIYQRAILVNRENRAPLLRHLIESEKYELVLVFMANKRAADNIAFKFRKHGFKTESFHGDLFQEDRSTILEEFKARKLQILFASDLASRGLDIDDIACVVNFDLPRSPADYIHRIGRTGRAGKKGVAISFVDYEDEAHFSLIEKRSNIKLQKEEVVGFECTGKLEKKEKAKEPVKGKRKSKKDKAGEAADMLDKEDIWN